MLDSHLPYPHGSARRIAMRRWVCSPFIALLTLGASLVFAQSTTTLPSGTVGVFYDSGIISGYPACAVSGTIPPDLACYSTYNPNSSPLGGAGEVGRDSAGHRTRGIPRDDATIVENTHSSRWQS